MLPKERSCNFETPIAPASSLSSGEDSHTTVGAPLHQKMSGSLEFEPLTACAVWRLLDFNYKNC
jgi:hypothetical protein